MLRSAEEPTEGSQSVRSSEETSNDRGAKGRRKAVLGAELRPSREDRHSAVRLCVSVRRKTAWPKCLCWQWAARNWVSGSARIARLACSLRASRNIDLSQPIDGCRLESRMREIRLSGLGGRGGVISAPPTLIDGLRAVLAGSQPAKSLDAGRPPGYKSRATHEDSAMSDRGPTAGPSAASCD